MPHFHVRRFFLPPAQPATLPMKLIILPPVASAYSIVCLTALIGSLLTFFSGFGLGTMLLPAFALFFPMPLAITLVAIVHFLNNIFKLGLLGRAANRKLVLTFGIPS